MVAAVYRTHAYTHAYTMVKVWRKHYRGGS